ncbi:MAG: protein kinase [Synechococcaceae cyanobacterium SM2_3_2]|nr:protein kinase [Synechococcaceae cyanobacterium SM2_3_2]
MNQRLVGQLIGNRYRLTQHISEGGYGNVYQAVDTQLNDQVVAVKLLRSPPPDMTPDYYHQLQERFMDEARVSALLGEHPGIVQVRSYGVFQQRPYLVMEFLKTGADSGRGLDSILSREKVIFPGRVLRLGIQICDGLDHAHNFHVDLGRYSIRGVVHRDIKPSNIFVMRTPDKREVVKLLDFGISKVMGEANRHLTQTGYFLGTMCYASPEQMRGEKLDSRSDIYSLGIVLYEMLTGALPFNPDTDSLPGWYHVHNYEKPIPFRSRSLPHTIPSALQKVVFACLQKEPERRPQTMLGLKQLLEGVLAQSYPSGSQPLPNRGGAGTSAFGKPGNPLADLIDQKPKSPSDAALSAPDYQRAMTLVEQKQFKEAIQLLNQLIRREPNESHYYLQRGLIHLNQSNWGLAQMDFQGVLRLDPNNGEAQAGFRQASQQNPDGMAAGQGSADPAIQDMVNTLGELSTEGSIEFLSGSALPWRLLVGWLVGSGVGSSLGLAAGLAVVGSPWTGGGILPAVAGMPMGWLAAGILALLLGLGAGIGQMLMLRPYLSRPWGWPILTLLGTLIVGIGTGYGLDAAGRFDGPELLAALVGQSIGLVGVGGLIAGVGVGLGQWVMLRGWGSRSWLWIPLAGLEMALGVAAVVALTRVSSLGALALLPLVMARLLSGVGLLILNPHRRLAQPKDGGTQPDPPGALAANGSKARPDQA